MISLFFLILVSFFAYSQEKKTDKITVRKESISSETVTAVPDVMPEYPGGLGEFYKFIAKSIVYPKIALDSGIVGSVYITFTILEDGTTGGLKILKGLCCGCNEETIRVLQMMPKWTPGILKGKPVKTVMTFPIRFKMQ